MDSPQIRQLLTTAAAAPGPVQANAARAADRLARQRIATENAIQQTLPRTLQSPARDIFRQAEVTPGMPATSVRQLMQQAGVTADQFERLMLARLANDTDN